MGSDNQLQSATSPPQMQTPRGCVLFSMRGHTHARANLVRRLAMGHNGFCWGAVAPTRCTRGMQSVSAAGSSVRSPVRHRIAHQVHGSLRLTILGGRKPLKAEHGGHHAPDSLHQLALGLHRCQPMEVAPTHHCRRWAVWWSAGRLHRPGLHLLSSHRTAEWKASFQARFQAAPVMANPRSCPGSPRGTARRIHGLSQRPSNVCPDAAWLGLSGKSCERSRA